MEVSQNWVFPRERSADPPLPILSKRTDGKIFLAYASDDFRKKKIWWRKCIFWKHVRTFLQFFFVKIKKYWVFPSQRNADPPPSVLVWFLWMMGSVLNRMRIIIKKFSVYLFFELSWKIHQKLAWWRHKMTKKWS